jgi:hypothetical protein
VNRDRSLVCHDDAREGIPALRSSTPVELVLCLFALHDIVHHALVMRLQGSTIISLIDTPQLGSHNDLHELWSVFPTTPSLVLHFCFVMVLRLLYVLDVRSQQVFWDQALDPCQGRLFFSNAVFMIAGRTEAPRCRYTATCGASISTPSIFTHILLTLNRVC